MLWWWADGLVTGRRIGHRVTDRPAWSYPVRPYHYGQPLSDDQGPGTKAAVPYSRFFTTPVHPGVQMGTEFDHRVRERSRLFQTAYVNYFHHNYLAQGVGLGTELGYEHRIVPGLVAEARFGLGYTHTFATTEEFTFTNGRYERKGYHGNARFTPSLSLDLGYYLKPGGRDVPKVFVRYQSWVEYPYSPGFIPIMSHINLHIGVRIPLKRKNDE